MTYALLNLVVLALVFGVSAMLVRATPPALRPRARTVLSAMAVLLVLTAVFDNIMIAVGLVGYDPNRYLGVLIGVAPIEDFGYSVAVAVFAPVFWHYLAARKAAE